MDDFAKAIEESLARSEPTDLEQKIRDLVHKYIRAIIHLALETNRTVYVDDIGRRIIELIRAEGFDLVERKRPALPATRGDGGDEEG